MIVSTLVKMPRLGFARIVVSIGALNVILTVVEPATFVALFAGVVLVIVSWALEVPTTSTMRSRLMTMCFIGAIPFASEIDPIAKRIAISLPRWGMRFSFEFSR